MRKFLCCAAAFAAVLLISCVVFAAANATYQETALPLPKSEHTELVLSDFCARSDGYINYYVTENSAGMPVIPQQYQSTDFGETWKKVDMGWYSQISGQYPKYGQAKDIYTADNGDLYCLVVTALGEQQIDKITTESYDVYKVYKYANGKAVQIPSLTIGSIGGPNYTIAKVYENGDIAIQQLGFPPVPTGVSVYDANGKFQKFTEMGDINWIPVKCFENAIYGIQYAPHGKAKIAAFDISTGKLVVSAPLPISSQDEVKSFNVSKNGTAYVTLTSGLYQCLPESGEFTKLIDGKNSRFGKNAGCSRLACTDDGTVYIPISFYNEKNEKDPNNGKQGRLYRYRPV